MSYEKRVPQFKDDLINFAKLFSYKFHANEAQIEALSNIRSNDRERIIDYWQHFLVIYSCCSSIESITTAQEVEKLIVEHFEKKFQKLVRNKWNQIKN